MKYAIISILTVKMFHSAQYILIVMCQSLFSYNPANVCNHQQPYKYRIRADMPTSSFEFVRLHFVQIQLTCLRALAAFHVSNDVC